MKTSKLISVISLALILVSAIRVSAGIPEKPVSIQNLSTITMFQVTVHLTSDLELCNNYEVRLIYGDGSLVAPPQPFVPGISVYQFSTSGGSEGLLRSQGWKSRITAMLVLVGSHEIVCPAELVTRPDTKTGPFFAGVTYLFNLYPNQILWNEKAVLKIKD
jgi:hypothetical protein